MHSPAIASEIGKREREIGSITERLAASKPVSVHARGRAMRGTVIARLAELRGFLESDATAMRPRLAQHTEKIDLHTDGPTIVVNGNWDLLGCIGWDGAEGGIAPSVSLCPSPSELPHSLHFRNPKSLIREGRCPGGNCGPEF